MGERAQAHDTAHTVRGRGGTGLAALVGRFVAVAFLAVGTLLVGAPLSSASPALAADPAPAPAPVPYGGALDNPDPGGSFDDSQVLEVAMLGLGALNGLAFAAVVIHSRIRGSSAAATRRALMTRTARGVPSGPRPRFGGTRHRDAH
ncbi:hypothetical protein PHK61_04415 [Actinomycetospora lutea]|uniref:hypothetical protein n=1 Tax=Actinomycetospora lutea TaxID=663604 RepID=UPI002365A08F|nr:hypothetical protein [Actinomycetospora lutea]MDD7937663.1 hypothetical protein [Actinomycetospora lutea]